MTHTNVLEHEKYILRHVAIIMDGNRRWAQKKGKKRILGHREGLEALKKAVIFSIIKKIKTLTLYAFSSENWHRPEVEVKALMKLFFFALQHQAKILKKYNIRLKILGDITRFTPKLQDRIQELETCTAHHSGLILNIAANYSGRWDIIQGIKKITQQIKKRKMLETHIQEKNFSQYLSTSGLDPVDLLIRTGGEKRISNFLLWQIAYSELYFTDVLWPDFNRHVFQHAVNFFLSRERRFGKL